MSLSNLGRALARSVPAARPRRLRITNSVSRSVMTWEVLEDGAGLEQADCVAPIGGAVVDDGRNLVVRCDAQEVLQELLILHEVHRNNAIRQP